MLKKNSQIVLILILGIALHGCKKDQYWHIPANERPKFKQGDTLIYSIGNDKKDTFLVSTLLYKSYRAAMDPVTFESLSYAIDKVTISNADTTGFNQITFFTNTQYQGSIILGLTRTTSNENLFYYSPPLDSIYQNISIGKRGYQLVYYYTLKTSRTHCRNLYFSYQYGILSIEINGNLIYLSEYKPTK
jgi:hypothetical protein